MHIISFPSPKFDERHRVPDMIILHYTDMLSGQESLQRLADPQFKVSAHYMVDVDGTIYGMVPENKRAWHAGISYWQGRDSLNQYSIGIELQNKGYSHGVSEPFPLGQMQAVIHLIKDIRTRWTIPDGYILGHSDIAPTRKQDPGHLFDWKILADHGIGIYPSNPSVESPANYTLLEVQQLLKTIGYSCPLSNEMDEVTLQVIEAFQRHWVPQELGQGLTPVTLGHILAVKALTLN